MSGKRDCNQRKITCENNNLGYCNKFKRWKRTELNNNIRVYVRLMECYASEVGTDEVIKIDHNFIKHDASNEEIPF